MSKLYQNWLTIWVIGVALFGLVLFGVGWPASDGIARSIFALMNNPLPDEPDRYLRFTTSLMGAVTLGWALTYYAAFRALWLLERAAAAPVWRILTVGAAIWYVIDSTSSIANGFALNAVSNTIVMALFAVPLIATGVLKAR